MKIPRPPPLPLHWCLHLLCVSAGACVPLPVCVCAVLRAFSAGANALIYCLPALWQCQGQRRQHREGKGAQQQERSSQAGSYIAARAWKGCFGFDQRFVRQPKWICSLAQPNGHEYRDRQTARGAKAVAAFATIHLSHLRRKGKRVGRQAKEFAAHS